METVNGSEQLRKRELAYSQPGLKGEPGSKNSAFWILKVLGK